MCFGKMVKFDERLQLASLLKVSLVENLGKYLGVLSFVGRNKKKKSLTILEIEFGRSLWVGKGLFSQMWERRSS